MNARVFGHPATVAWLLLVIATGVGWALGHSVRANGSVAGSVAMVGVITTAFVKVWIVGFQFMELRDAPWWLRRGFDAWVLVVGSVLVVISLG
ncbi:MAG: hypothetical protein FHP94_09165 [Denitromonas halophila]|nr:MAG: hypothetical protein FHP94_09165 [Denitromonas halophila]TVT75709.1 MAG: hypothetical protein FHP93_00475 [Denitromonas halophila]